MPGQYTMATCPTCGNAFRTFPSLLARGHGRFCSKPCSRPRRKAYRAVNDRFWEKVMIPPGDGCWLWVATLSSTGYGMFTVRRGLRAATHRFSWELHFGPIPDGLLVCHHCDVPACVRPDHLFLGTHADNARDSVQKGRRIGKRGTRKHIE